MVLSPVASRGDLDAKLSQMAEHLWKVLGKYSQKTLRFVVGLEQMVPGRALKSVTWLGGEKDKKEQVSCSFGSVTNSTNTMRSGEFSQPV